MRVESNEPARFGRESPVLRHWVANSVGFSVEGPGCRGVVERVYGLPGAATSIAVRRRLRRRTLVPADHVIEVVPADELLVVGRTPERTKTPRPSHRLGERTRAATRRGGIAFGRAAASSYRQLARLATILVTLTEVAVRGALRILRDAAVTLRELAEAGWPVVRRGVGIGRRRLATVIAQASEAVQRAHSRRRRERLARSLEAMVAALARERGSSNGHVSPQGEREPPRVKN